MKERIVFLDFIRVFACFLVILVHASENFYPGPESTDMAGPTAMLTNEADRLWVSIYDGFSRIAVPLFIIVSAYLLVPKNEQQSTFQFYRKRFTKILPPFIFFSILYATLPMIWGQLSFNASLNDLWHIPFNFPSIAGHLWFMFPLISLYLFIPIISPWIRHCSVKEEQFFIVLFLISTCIPYLNRFIGEVWGQCFWNQYHMLWYFSGYIGYLMIAHYIRTKLTWTTSKKIFIGIVLLSVGSLATILSYYVQAVPQIIHDTPTLEIGWAFCTINVVVATTGAFLLFSCINIKTTPKIILSLSKLSYGIYLVHIFWLHLFANLVMNSLALQTVIDIPLIAILTFVASVLTIKIISFIPKSHWIIG